MFKDGKKTPVGNRELEFDVVAESMDDKITIQRFADYIFYFAVMLYGTIIDCRISLPLHHLIEDGACQKL